MKGLAARPLLLVAGGLVVAALLAAVLYSDRRRPGELPPAAPPIDAQLAAGQPAAGQAAAGQAAAAPGGRVALLDIIQASDHPLRVFELKPGLQAVPFKNAPTSTNSLGFRYREVLPDEGPDTITIVGLGDSFMFGLGVPDGSDYPALLERLLQDQHPGKPWRVINLALPASNTVMEVETLARCGLQFEPDLVILHIVPNDLVLPEYVRRPDGAAVPAPDPAHPARDPRLQHISEVNSQDAAFRELVGWVPFVRALDRLSALAKEHGFGVVVFTSAEDQTTVDMVRMAVERGCTHISLMPEIQQHLASKYQAQFSMQAPEAYLNSDLVYAPGDGHPSVLQNRMAAEKLLRQLGADGVIERLMQ